MESIQFNLGKQVQYKEFESPKKKVVPMLYDPCDILVNLHKKSPLFEVNNPNSNNNNLISTKPPTVPDNSIFNFGQKQGIHDEVTLPTFIPSRPNFNIKKPIATNLTNNSNNNSPIKNLTKDQQYNSKATIYGNQFVPITFNLPQSSQPINIPVPNRSNSNSPTESLSPLGLNGVCNLNRCILCERCIPSILTKTPTWASIMKVVLYTLHIEHPNKQFFSLKTDVYDFMLIHWDKLYMNKKKRENWKKQIQDMLSHSKNVFESGMDKVKSNGYWKLKNVVDPWLIQEQIPRNISKPSNNNSANNSRTTSPININGESKKRSSDDEESVSSSNSLSRSTSAIITNSSGSAFVSPLELQLQHQLTLKKRRHSYEETDLTHSPVPNSSLSTSPFSSSPLTSSSSSSPSLIEEIKLISSDIATLRNQTQMIRDRIRAGKETLEKERSIRDISEDFQNFNHFAEDQMKLILDNYKSIESMEKKVLDLEIQEKHSRLMKVISPLCGSASICSILNFENNDSFDSNPNYVNKN